MGHYLSEGHDEGASREGGAQVNQVKTLLLSHAALHKSLESSQEQNNEISDCALCC